MQILLNIIIFFLQVDRTYAIGLVGQQCVIDSHHSGWTDLKKVAVMPEDGRYGITDGANKVGLSPEEAEWIRSVTGAIICRDPKTKALTGGTGTLLGRDDQIVTSAHVVLDNKKIRPECYFMTKTDPPIWRTLLLSSKQTAFGTKDTGTSPNKDLAIVKLDKPLTGAKPVKIMPSIRLLDRKENIILVSARQWRLTRSVGENEPIVQACMVRHIDPVRSDDSRMMHTDCSVTETSSGSMNYVRGKDGQLYGVGVVTMGTGSEFDGKAYDYFTRNTAKSLVFDDIFRTQLSKNGVSF